MCVASVLKAAADVDAVPAERAAPNSNCKHLLAKFARPKIIVAQVYRTGNRRAQWKRVEREGREREGE